MSTSPVWYGSSWSRGSGQRICSVVEPGLNTPAVVSCSSPAVVLGAYGMQSAGATNLKSSAATALGAGTARPANATMAVRARVLAVIEGSFGRGARPTLDRYGDEL